MRVCVCLFRFGREHWHPRAPVVAAVSGHGCCGGLRTLHTDSSRLEVSTRRTSLQRLSQERTSGTDDDVDRNRHFLSVSSQMSEWLEVERG